MMFISFSNIGSGQFSSMVTREVNIQKYSVQKDDWNNIKSEQNSKCKISFFMFQFSLMLNNENHLN